MRKLGLQNQRVPRAIIRHTDHDSDDTSSSDGEDISSEEETAEENTINNISTKYNYIHREDDESLVKNMNIGKCYKFICLLVCLK